MLRKVSNLLHPMLSNSNLLRTHEETTGSGDEKINVHDVFPLPVVCPIAQKSRFLLPYARAQASPAFEFRLCSSNVERNYERCH